MRLVLALCFAASGAAISSAQAQSDVKLAAGMPASFEDRLAPRLPLTQDEKATIARIKADPSALNLSELAAIRHGLAQAYRDAADLAGNADALRIAILYGASAVDLDPGNQIYLAALGDLYSRYAPFELSAGPAALKAYASSWRVAPDASIARNEAQSLLDLHRHRLRDEHLARTYPGPRGALYVKALDFGSAGAPDTAPGSSARQQFLRAEISDLDEKFKAIETRRVRWQARMSELQSGAGDASPVAFNNVKSQWLRLEIESQANRLAATQLESWQNGESVADPGNTPVPDVTGRPPRSSLATAREILALSARPRNMDEDTGHPPAGFSAPAGLSTNITALLATAHHAHRHALVEPITAQTLADRDLIERLTRLTSKPKPGEAEPDPSVAAANPAAPPVPSFRVLYGPHKSTRPQTDNDPRFARAGAVEGPVPVGAALRFEADVEIPSADPQPWVGFAWVLYDVGGNNPGPVTLGKAVNKGKPVAFNKMGAVQLGGHGSNQPAQTSLNFDLPTGGLATGPYEMVLAAFYLGDDGAFDPDKALLTTVLARKPFELVNGKISVYLDIPKRMASPGWSSLTVITSDWIQSPYTVEVSLDNLVFRDTGGETVLSASGLSPLLKFGGVMTAPNDPPNAPPNGEASISVHVTDGRGRSANATARLEIGGRPQTTFIPEALGSDETPKHPE